MQWKATPQQAMRPMSSSTGRFLLGYFYVFCNFVSDCHLYEMVSYQHEPTTGRTPKSFRQSMMADGIGAPELREYPSRDPNNFSDRICSGKRPGHYNTVRQHFHREYPHLNFSNTWRSTLLGNRLQEVHCAILCLDCC